MLLFVILLFLMAQATSELSTRNNNGFGFLRKQVADLQKKNDHYKYIVDRIVDKIEDSLQFPKRKRKDMILDKESGIKYIIKKIKNDGDAIGTNLVFLDMNPNAMYTYEVRFYVYGKFAEEDIFELFPTSFKKSKAKNEGSLYYLHRNHTFIDIFGYNETESIYFPRSFYEAVDANGVLDVREI